MRDDDDRRREGQGRAAEDQPEHLGRGDVRYVVEPKRAGRVRTILIKKMLERLNAEPDRGLFPKSNLR